VKYDKPEAEPGAVAAYAQREDYHHRLRDTLEELARRMRELRTGSRTRVLVDTAPLLEREAAQRAGLGWIGKSTMLVHRRFGCYTLLGEILWTERVDPDTPALDQCGTCTRCLDACPTDALLHPYEMDATQCLSYHSIERRGRIPEELRAAQEERVFGCDACLHVCPVGGEIGEGTLLPTLEWLRDASLEELLTRTCDSFKRNFGSSPVERTRKLGMLRALMVAFGNSGRREATAQIEAFAEHEDVDVRTQARWALRQLA
jgi:epoxyqueuosine reductase